MENIDSGEIEVYSRWKKLKLGELCSKIGSGATPTGGGQAYKEFGISLIRSQNILDFKFGYDGLAFIDDEQAFALKNVTVQVNDVLLNITGDSVARVCKVPSEVLPARVNQHVAILRAKNVVLNNDFLLYQLQAKKESLLILSEIGGTRNALTKVMIEDFEINLPPLPEQTAIASILSSLDDKIDLLHRQNKTLEQLAETLFRQWFVEEAEVSWANEKLGKIFDIGIGRTPPRKEQHWFTLNPNDVKWVSIKDMGTSGIYIDTVSEYLTKEAVEQYSVPVIPANTVILSFKMTIGRLAISTERMVSNEAIAHFKQKEGSYLFPEFLYLFLKTYSWVELGSTSSIVESINSQMIKEIEMVIPERQKLVDFKELVKPTFDKIKSNQIQIRTLVQTRDTLLPKLMSGEVRVLLNKEVEYEK
ncbi:MAG: restriction endonuclease subunit S [Bacteroidetes bacterium]|nr:restriction endonuclease subunit S [Bacteroidota bacterium]